jgi:Leucine rich repeat variant
MTTPEALSAGVGRAERRELALHSDDHTTLRQLADDLIWRVRRAVAQNPATPPDVLERLARDPHDEVRARVARHESCPAAAIATLLEDPRRPVRNATIARGDVSLDVLVRLAERDAFARETLQQHARDRAAHPLMMASSDPRVRLLVAESGVADDHTLRRLAQDDDARIQIALVNHPLLPNDVVRRLANIDRLLIQRVLAARRDLPGRAWSRLLRSGDDQTVRLLAQNTGLRAIATLRVLVFSRLNRRWVTTVLAASDATPRAYVWFLSHSRHWQIRRAVASRPKISRRTMRRLAKDKAWAVKAALARRPDLPHKVQWALMGAEGPRLSLAANNSIAADVADALVKDTSDEFVAGRVLANPAVSAEMLVHQADGLRREPWVLRNIAENPNCPGELRDEILTWLALGGAGSKDPLFDPVTCRSHPGDTKQPAFAYYTELAKTRQGEPQAPLWAARAAKVRRLSNDTGRLARYADDDHVEVRRALLQGILPHRCWREMAWDESPFIRQAGVPVWQSCHFPRRRELLHEAQWLKWYKAKGRRLLTPALILSMLVGLTVVVVATAFSSGLSPGTYGVFSVIIGMAVRSRRRGR